jgi:glycerol-3-phosphate dehydrogenase
VSYSIERELCTNPLDFLARRTRIAFLDRKTLDELLPVVVEEIARHYNFDPERQAEYLNEYQILVGKMEF